jgi:5-methylthioadenosine/S-adenosylhomocysteine deaminase
MWAIRGRLVPLTSDPTVAPNETAVFTGKVWMSDDGIIIAVTRGSQPGPPG